jgi:glycosyltransferase involved in cell wall biosynthesis
VGVPATIAVPGVEARRVPRGLATPCPAWRVPFGPLVVLGSRVAPRRPWVAHVHGLAALVPWAAFLPPARPDAVVATLHGVLDCRAAAPQGALKRLWHRRVDVPLLGRLDGVHVTRDSERASAGPWLRPGALVEELPWTLADPGAAPEGPSPRRRPYLLAVGRLHPIKAFGRLLDAVASAGTALSEAEVVVAGPGSARSRADLAAHARRLGLGDRLAILGLLPPARLRAFYAHARALALPSAYENFGMVVLEALREGCPVVAALETPWAVLETAGAGRHADFGHPPQAGAALARALDPAWRAAAGGAARALFAERYAPDRVAPRFSAWYAEVLRRAAS